MVRGLGRKTPEAKTVCRHCLEILTAETIKIERFRTVRFLILDHRLMYDGGSSGVAKGRGAGSRAIVPPPV